MPLFVAQHRHPAAACPAAPAAGALLLAHISAATAARYGLAIQAEAVLDEAHELILVVEAAERAQVERFMALFARFASRQDESFAAKIAAALREQFGGHAVKRT